MVRRLTSAYLLCRAAPYPAPSWTDVRIADGRINAIGNLAPQPGETVIDAAGGCLLPGLNDHHIHLAAFAASFGSVMCGPPAVATTDALIAVLNTAESPTGWLRGIGYHESVAGELDRAWLDRHGPERPVRIQHRSGRLWIFNSAAIARIAAATNDAATELVALLTANDGRLFDRDALLADALPRSNALPIREASAQLASYGITGLNDMTVRNDADTWQWFDGLQREGALSQQVRLSGQAILSDMQETPTLAVGETKFHLHEHALPDFEQLCQSISASHAANRPIAVHCVTRTELIFTLAALKETGTIHGDRIEHAAIADREAITMLQSLGPGIVTQPAFILERGDAYRRDVPPADHDNLYRCASLQVAGLRLAFGSDAPFGSPSPWVAMAAATDRETTAGFTLGPQERMTPEAALAACLGSLEDPFTPIAISTGAKANLCLLHQSWAEARQDLTKVSVQLTMQDGRIIHRQPTG